MAQAARGLVVVGEMTGLPRLRARRLPFTTGGGRPTRRSSEFHLENFFAHRLASEVQGSEPRGLFPAQGKAMRLSVARCFTPLRHRYCFEARFSWLGVFGLRE
jgi:hypothetical protein